VLAFISARNEFFKFSKIFCGTFCKIGWFQKLYLFLQEGLADMTTKEELRGYFQNIDQDKKQFAYDTIDEYIEYRDRLAEIRDLPDIERSKKNPSRVRITPAAKLRKEYSQVLDSKRATLLRILYKVENSAADDLLAKLAEFE